MIDTVKIPVPFKDIQITKPERFGGIEQIQQMQTCFVAGKGKLEYPNEPTSEEKQQGYFPRLSLVRRAYAINDSFLNLYIECSLPKILFNNNIEELKNSDFPAVITALQNKLATMGVVTSREALENAHVQRVDYAKNFQIQGSPKLFIYYMEKIDIDPRVGNFDRDYQNGGTGLKFHTKYYQVMIYDKMAEIEKSLRYSDGHSLTCDNYSQRDIVARLKERGIKLIRYEVSLRRKKLRGLGKKMREITPPEYTLKYVFNSDVSKRVLTHYITRIHAGMRSLNLNSTETIAVINRIKEASPSAKGNKLAALEGFMRYVNEYGYDFLRNELGMSSSMISKIRSEIREINAIPNDVCVSGVMADMLAIEQSLANFGALRINRDETS